MSIRELTCIGCPMGCQLTAVLEDGQVTRVTGNTCPRGDVPKERVLDVARALCRVHLTAPVAAGDVVIPDVLGTGVDVVATRSV